jgi:hypothetical protein
MDVLSTRTHTDLKRSANLSYTKRTQVKLHETNMHAPKKKHTQVRMPVHQIYAFKHARMQTHGWEQKSSFRRLNGWENPICA